MVQINDLSRSLAAFDPISTLVVVVEMSKASWLVSGVVPGVERQPLKKLEPDATALLRLIERWRNEAVRAGRPISRIALAYEAGRDGFWLARWLIARGIEAHVIHSASVAVSRERKRAKTDRLDAAMLMRVFLGWLRGERGHCGMVAIPTIEEEDARRPNRERESLVNERSRIINRMKSALARLGIRGCRSHALAAQRRARRRFCCRSTSSRRCSRSTEPGERDAFLQMLAGALQPGLPLIVAATGRADVLHVARKQSSRSPTSRCSMRGVARGWLDQEPDFLADVARLHTAYEAWTGARERDKAHALLRCC